MGIFWWSIRKRAYLQSCNGISGISYEMHHAVWHGGWWGGGVGGVSIYKNIFDIYVTFLYLCVYRIFSYIYVYIHTYPYTFIYRQAAIWSSVNIWHTHTHTSSVHTCVGVNGNINLFLKTFRPKKNLQCLRSMFQIHNETGNIWSHFSILFFFLHR